MNTELTYTDHLVDDHIPQPAEALVTFMSMFPLNDFVFSGEGKIVTYKLSSPEGAKGWGNLAVLIIKQLQLPLEATREDRIRNGKVYETNLSIEYSIK